MSEGAGALQWPGMSFGFGPEIAANDSIPNLGFTLTNTTWPPDGSNNYCVPMDPSSQDINFGWNAEANGRTTYDLSGTNFDISANDPVRGGRDIGGTGGESNAAKHGYYWNSTPGVENEGWYKLAFPRNNPPWPGAEWDEETGWSSQEGPRGEPAVIHSQTVTFEIKKTTRPESREARLFNSTVWYRAYAINRYFDPESGEPEQLGYSYGSVGRLELKKSVILIQDAFTSFYESQVVMEFHELLKKLGFKVYIAPFHPNGKPLHVKGFLNQFKATAEKNVEWLRKISLCGIPIVGLDPAVVLTYRDEYLEILGVDRLSFEVMLPQEFLISKFKNFRNFSISKKQKDYQLLGHCTEKTDALLSQEQWKDLFRSFGLSLRLVDVGCCGMAGTFGHEKEHFEDSFVIYNLSWKKMIPEDPFMREKVLTTGFSCRSQVKRFEGFRPMHPLQALLREIKVDEKI